MNLFQKIYYVLGTEFKYRSMKNASLDGLNRGLSSKAVDSVSSEKKESIVKRIIEAYLKAKKAQEEVPLVYLPGHKWAPQILEKRFQFIQALNDKDVRMLSQLFDNFFRNNGVISIIKYELFPQLANESKLKSITARKNFIYNLYRDVEVWKEFSGEKSYSQLSTPFVGNPYGCVIDDVLITATACPANYYAKKIAHIQKFPAFSVIAEIGGGVGTLGYFLLNDNPSNTYINFDIPEVLIIAQYYLMMAFPEKRVLLFGESDKEEIDENIIASYDLILMPNFMIRNLPSNSVDLFFNSHSLSEMDYATIDEYLHQISRVTKTFFYHENSEFPKDIGYGNLEVPASSYPINNDQFDLMYRSKAIWNEPRYWEYLYKKKSPQKL